MSACRFPDSLCHLFCVWFSFIDNHSYENFVHSISASRLRNPEPESCWYCRLYFFNFISSSSFLTFIASWEYNYSESRHFLIHLTVTASEMAMPLEMWAFHLHSGVVLNACDLLPVCLITIRTLSLVVCIDGIKSPIVSHLPPVIFYYDWLLMLDHEIQLAWRTPKAFFMWLFLFQRYFTFLTVSLFALSLYKANRTPKYIVAIMSNFVSYPTAAVCPCYLDTHLLPQVFWLVSDWRVAIITRYSDSYKCWPHP